jgi:hypothetical protein
MPLFSLQTSYFSGNFRVLLSYLRVILKISARCFISSRVFDQEVINCDILP